MTAVAQRFGFYTWFAKCIAMENINREGIDTLFWSTSKLFFKNLKTSYFITYKMHNY